jgi:transketolase
MTQAAKSSHVGSCLSSADLLAVLYGNTLRVNPADPDWPDRDRFVLSKGHAAIGLYPILADLGYYPPSELDNCPDRRVGQFVHGEAGERLMELREARNASTEV